MKDVDRLDRLIGLVVICIIIIAALIIGIRLWSKKSSESAGDTTAEKTEKKHAASEPDIPLLEYGSLGKKEQLDTLMQARKESLGIEKGLDIIAKPEESLKIGEFTVSMKEVLDKIRLKEGEIIEKDLTAPGQEKRGGLVEQSPAPGPGLQKRPLKEDLYGIYVVRPGDNIWNIHFTFLKSYYDHRGVQLSTLSDEPDNRGQSSGVGKLLKFSEKMVYIYNIRQRKIDVNLDLIHPLSKIVIFKMKQIFILLEQIDYQHVNRLQFDGDTLWLPARQ